MLKPITDINGMTHDEKRDRLFAEYEQLGTFLHIKPDIDHAIYVNETWANCYYSYGALRTPYAMNDINDVYWKPGTVVEYHQHANGCCETFVITEGCAECTLRGHKTTLTKGDMLHITGGIPHMFSFPEKCTWREVFQGMDMYQNELNKRTVYALHPELLSDPVLKERYMNPKIKGFYQLPKVVEAETPKSEVREVREAGKGLSAFTLGGVTLLQKVGRWETYDVRESWEAVMKKGAHIEWNEPYYNQELFSIENGSFKVDIEGHQFVAEAGDIVQVPAYMTHTIISLEDGSSFLDFTVRSHLLNALEELEYIRQTEPGKLEDRAFAREILLRHGSFVTDVK